MKNKVIYTSLEDFKSDKYIVKSYNELPLEYKYWIDENAIKLLQNRNKCELNAEQLLRSKIETVHVQPFFRIHGRAYFLDFYIPKYNTAIEIDGSYHNYRKKEDEIRDKDFADIGIRTIRIKAKDVIEDKFLMLIYKQSRKPLHKKKKKKRKVVYRKKETIRDANWI